MAYTIAQVRTAVLALLDDVSAVRYTSAQIDQAARTALIDYDIFKPVVRTYAFETDGNKMMELPTSFATTAILRIEEYNADPDLVVDLRYRAKMIDEQWVINIEDTQYAAGVTLTIYYLGPNTVDGLDSAAGTTVLDSSLFCQGCAGYAAQSRAVSRAESINLQASVMSQLLQLSQKYLTAYMAGLRNRPAEANYYPMTMPEVRF